MTALMLAGVQVEKRVARLAHERVFDLEIPERDVAYLVEQRAG